MFHLHNKLKYFLYPAPVDMRMSFYSLAGIARSIMKGDIRNGDVYIFINRSRNTMKILHMEHGGLVIYHKKLDEGTFRLPSFGKEKNSQQLTWEGLMEICQNLKKKRQRLKYY